MLLVVDSNGLDKNEERHIAKVHAVQVPTLRADFELVERDMPEPGPAQVRIRMPACGIGPSDVVTKEDLFPGMS